MLFIHGIGHFHPENVIDNALLEELDIGTGAGLTRATLHIQRR